MPPSRAIGHWRSLPSSSTFTLIRLPKAGTQQPVRMEPLQPLRITNIGLAPGDMLGIAGVDKKHSEPTCIEKLENRYPVDAGQFHDDGLDAASRTFHPA